MQWSTASRLDFPQVDGEWLFQKARLTVTALIAKIHTTEWTPSLMNSPEGRFAMRGNWWGIAGEHYWRAYGRLSDSEEISGVPGSPGGQDAAPYAMTEEFTACYRMHPLMPDEFSLRSHSDDRELARMSLLDVAHGGPARIYRTTSFDDVVYSLATSNPGALVLHNYPNSLRRLPEKPDQGIYTDLAATDILRDRERGVPRYCQFRRLIGMPAPKSFEELTTNPQWREEVRAVYATVEDVDLLVGTLCEAQANPGTPPGFGFSDTVFRIFILMASRRLRSDRFFTTDFTPDVYTPAGLPVGRRQQSAHGASTPLPLARAAVRRRSQRVLPLEPGHDMRLRIPALLDLMTVDDPGMIADLANDPRLDRNYGGKGPLFNRIVTGRIRRALSLNGEPLPSVAPRGPERPKPAQAALEARLNQIASTLSGGDPSVQKLAGFVRGEGPASLAGPLTQQAVGRLFNPDYQGDAKSWAAAQVLDQAPRTLNVALLIWWSLTGAVTKARRVLSDKVGGDPSGVHGTGVAVHNLVAGFSRMRTLWKDPAQRRLSPEAAAAQCLFAPEQVVRQPTEPGVTLAGDFSDATLILLQLNAANARAPSAGTAFMAQSWARCPAHAWAPALLAAVWRAAQR